MTFFLFFLLKLYESRVLATLATLLVIIAVPVTRLRRLAFLPLIRWPLPARLRLTLPEAVILTLLLKPLWVFCLAI